MWWGSRGIPPAQMNSMVPRIHMGRRLCPKPSLFYYFQGISRFPGKLQAAPQASLVVPYSPLWPLALPVPCRDRLSVVDPFAFARVLPGQMNLPFSCPLKSRIPKLSCPLRDAQLRRASRSPGKGEADKPSANPGRVQWRKLDWPSQRSTGPTELQNKH